jgi:hypothetical protein
MTLITGPRTEVAPSGAGFDSFLGAAQERYLGEGHRRVGLYLSDLKPAEDLSYGGIAQVTYPSDWSLKAGITRDAHLSTVDAIRIANAAHTALQSGQLPWLAEYGFERSLTVRAGARPWDGLDMVPVRSVIHQESATVRAQHTVGSLKVETEWVRSVPATEASGAWEAGVVRGVRLKDSSHVTCRYERTSPATTPVSFLETMLLAAQMAQVALYQGDVTRRAQSGNMWMRRAGFVRHAHPIQQTAQIELTVLNQRDLIVGGRRVGTADVLAEDVFGVQVTASLATGA